MTGHAVVIAGGGPTGLMLAGELALAGIDVAIVERRASQDLPGSRAGGLHARTIEVLDQRGIADRFLSEGQEAQVAAFAGTALDISDFPTRHPYGLGLWQNHIERILAGWVDELEVPIYREREVTGFAQDDTGVDVELSDGQPLRAEYLIGCDGGRSVVRKAAGIEFPGWDPTTSSLIAEAEMAEGAGVGHRPPRRGVHGIGRVEYEIRDGEVVYSDRGPVRVGVAEEHVGATTEPTLRELSEALVAVYGTQYRDPQSHTWISRFNDMTGRPRPTTRDGPVAGDAAHVRSRSVDGPETWCAGCAEPGWSCGRLSSGRRGKASSILPCRAPPGRCPRVAQHDRAGRAHARRRPHRGGARHRVGAAEHGRAAQAVRRDDVRPQHLVRAWRRPPLLGRRMPDLDLVTANGSQRVFTLLHDARPVLLNLGEPGGFDIAPWADRVQLIDARIRRSVGASGTWRGPCSHRRRDSARRIRRLGGRRPNLRGAP